MDIDEIKELIERSTKIDPTFYEIPITPTSTNPRKSYKLIRQYIWIIPLHDNGNRPFNLTQSNIPINKVHDDKNSIEVWMFFDRKDDKSVVFFECTKPTMLLPYCEDEGDIISRIKVLGNNGIRMKSNWIFRWYQQFTKYTFNGSKTLSDMYTPETVFQSITLSEGTGNEFKFQNFHVVIIEIAESGSKSLKPAQKQLPKLDNQLDNILLTNAKMLSKKYLTDMEIIVLAKGKIVETIKAHKAILAARSEVFLAMLQAPMKEGELSNIEIVDFEPETVHELLKYLYVGEMDLDTYAMELFRCADKYAINELSGLCEKFMAQNVEKVGWIGVFNLLHTYDKGLSVLRAKVKEYYKVNECSLQFSEDFRSAIQMYPEQFVKLYIP